LLTGRLPPAGDKSDRHGRERKGVQRRIAGSVLARRLGARGGKKPHKTYHSYIKDLGMTSGHSVSRGKKEGGSSPQNKLDPAAMAKKPGPVPGRGDIPRKN